MDYFAVKAFGRVYGARGVSQGRSRAHPGGIGERAGRGRECSAHPPKIKRILF
nr:MAG TPA: hypothetical protein [Siphoviridae sp. ctYuc6]